MHTSMSLATLLILALAASAEELLQARMALPEITAAFPAFEAPVKRDPDASAITITHTSYYEDYYSTDGTSYYDDYYISTLANTLANTITYDSYSYSYSYTQYTTCPASATTCADQQGCCPTGAACTSTVYGGQNYPVCDIPCVAGAQTCGAGCCEAGYTCSNGRCTSSSYSATTDYYVTSSLFATTDSDAATSTSAAYVAITSATSFTLSVPAVPAAPTYSTTTETTSIPPPSLPEGTSAIAASPSTASNYTPVRTPTAATPATGTFYTGPQNAGSHTVQLSLANAVALGMVCVGLLAL